jgi:peptide chain release factor 2
MLTCSNSEVIFDIDAKNKQIEDFSRQMSDAGFWNDSELSASVVKQLKCVKLAVEPWETSWKKYLELKELSDILTGDEQELMLEVEKNVALLQQDLEKLEFTTILNGEFDKNNAILSINAGAGGTESCDWVEMLFRMYTRFAESKKYAVKTIDVLFGEEAGIKNVTVFIEGPYAYGYLKAERGVHRLVRISPFDSNKRRHTTFASVDVIPEVEGDIEVKIEEKDLTVDTFRASGPGGQHMQKTDSAVRITHLPSGIVVACQNERSQHQNKQNALKILKARLYELEQEKKDQEISKQAATKKKIEWGSQIRSYVMHPYTMVKDHRTGYETGNVQAVMDGQLGEFIEAYLKLQKTR